MSYVRLSAKSDVYVLATVDDLYECCGCFLCIRTAPQPPSHLASLLPPGPYTYRGSFYTKNAVGMIAHLKDHVAAGHKVPQKAFRRLGAEIKADELLALGYVRKESHWGLPAILELVRWANTDWWVVPSGTIKRQLEAWEPRWAAYIAKLPVPINERRRILCAIATDPDRRAATEAAFDAYGDDDPPHRLIYDIARD